MFISTVSATWDTEVVTQGPNQYGVSSIAVDSAGNPHISYYNSGNHNLEYANKTGLTWVIETVENGITTNPTTYWSTLSIAMDSSSNPHIGYYNQATGQVKYASKSGGIWTTETVESLDDVSDCSLAFDLAGNPHISYGFYNYPNPNSLHYASKTGGIWGIESVSTEDDSTQGCSLAFDSSNIPHIIIYGESDKKIIHTTKINGNWVTTAVTNGTSLEYVSNEAIAIDSNDNMHITYKIYASQGTNYIMYGFLEKTTPTPVDPINSSTQTNSTTVNAAIRTIGMQETGLPIQTLILAILMVLVDNNKKKIIFFIFHFFGLFLFYSANVTIFDLMADYI